MTRNVLVCQNRACRKAGSAKVLAAFQASIFAEGTASEVTASEVTVTGCQCLGQCGNGPMVLILPDQVWYHRVHINEVSAIVRCHLQAGQQVSTMLYPKFHGS